MIVQRESAEGILDPELASDTPIERFNPGPVFLSEASISAYFEASKPGTLKLTDRVLDREPYFRSPVGDGISEERSPGVFGSLTL